MMTMKQIMELMRCSGSTAKTRLSKAGITPIRLSGGASGGGGIRHLYDITPEQVLELKDASNRNLDQVVAQQGQALSALESLFGARRI
ncbi:MAG: hypothetical protein IPI17_01850 [Nitrosomonas sp.]|nr:hypothetical protein [Nitrosomonas sp.]